MKKPVLILARFLVTVTALVLSVAKGANERSARLLDRVERSGDGDKGVSSPDPDHLT